MDQTNFPLNALPGVHEVQDEGGGSLDKRIVQERNRTSILHWLARFGWLTSRMLVALVWPTSAQGMAMCRRTLKQLVDEKYVISRPLSNGGAAYLLAAKGARLLSEQLGIQASSGNGFAIGNPVHRACTVWYQIDAIQRGLEVVTEHEVSSEQGPVRVLRGKTSDGLVIADMGAIWMECENTYKNRDRRDAIVSLCRTSLGGAKMTELAPDLYLERLAILATTPDALRSIAASFRDAHRRGELREEQLALVDVTLLPVSPSLVPGDRLDGNLWWDIVLPSTG